MLTITSNSFFIYFFISWFTLFHFLFVYFILRARAGALNSDLFLVLMLHILTDWTLEKFRTRVVVVVVVVIVTQPDRLLTCVRESSA